MKRVGLNVTPCGQYLFSYIRYLFSFLLGRLQKDCQSRRLISILRLFLALLEIISESKDERTAFGFIDEGSFEKPVRSIILIKSKQRFLC